MTCLVSNAMHNIVNFLFVTVLLTHRILHEWSFHVTVWNDLKNIIISFDEQNPESMQSLLCQEHRSIVLSCGTKCCLYVSASRRLLYFFPSVHFCWKCFSSSKTYISYEYVRLLAWFVALRRYCYYIYDIKYYANLVAPWKMSIRSRLLLWVPVLLFSLLFFWNVKNKISAILLKP